MSFVLGRPIDSVLVDQVEARQDILGKPDRIIEGDYSFFLQKMPWIKLTSAVDVRGSDELARLNVLTNGINLAGSSEVFGYQDTNLGVRPKPGITSMNLSTHNRYGSLRTATVQFIVHSVDQLNTYEQLFMRPGYSALLEWGHSKYLDAKTSVYKVKDIPTLIDFFKGEGSPKTKNELYKKLNAMRKEYHYNYDGMYGLIKNFSWSLQQDGTYACSVDIVSIGSTLESLNLNVAVTNNEIARYTQFAADVTRAERLKNPPAGQDVIVTGTNGGGVQGVTETLQSKSPATESDIKFAELMKEAMDYYTTAPSLDTDAKTVTKNGIADYGYRVGWNEDAPGTVNNITINAVANSIKKVNGKSSSERYKFLLIDVTTSPALQIKIYSPPVFFKNNISDAVGYLKPGGELIQAMALVDENTPLKVNGKYVPADLSGKTGGLIDSTIKKTAIFYYGYPIPNSYSSYITEDESAQLNFRLIKTTPFHRDDLQADNYRVGFVEYIYEVTPIPLDTFEDIQVTAQASGTAATTTTTATTQAEDKVPEDEALDIFEIIATDKEPLQSRIHYILHQAKHKISQDRPASEVKRNGVHTLQKSDMKYYVVDSAYTAMHSKSVTVKSAEGTDSTELIYYSYIQLGFLLDVLNTLMPKDGAEGEELFKFHTGKNVIHYMKTLSILHYSVDTSKCLLPRSSGPVDILSIFVEIDYIGDVVESFFRQGQIRLYDLIDTILKDIIVAVGNFNSFELQYFELDNTFHIVDRELLDPDAIKDRDAVISIFGKNSFVRNLNLTSKLSPQIGAQLAIAAQAEPESNGIEGTGWSKFNARLKDRFIAQKIDDVTRAQVAAAKASAEKQSTEEKLKAYADVFDYLRATYPDGGTASYYYRRAVDSVIPQYAIFCQRQLVDQMKAGQDFGFIIPYELSLTLEGISGFNVMESFRIYDNIIPDTYKSNSKNGIAFLITGVQQSVTTAGWTTTVKAQIYNTNSKGRSGAPMQKEEERGLTPPPFIGSQQEGGTGAPGANGRYPENELELIGIGQHKLLKGSPATDFKRMYEAAKQEGVDITVSDSYRTFQSQNSIFDWDLYVQTGGSRTDTSARAGATRAKKGTNGTVSAAFPGTSNHGNGISLDISTEVAQNWVKKNGFKYNWSWYEGKSVNENWHFTWTTDTAKLIDWTA